MNADADFIRDLVNDQLIPRMLKHGFPLKGLRFNWDESVDYTPEQQVAYESMIADRYEVDAGILYREVQHTHYRQEGVFTSIVETVETPTAFFRLGPDDFTGLHNRMKLIMSDTCDDCGGTLELADDDKPNTSKLHKGIQECDGVAACHR